LLVDYSRWAPLALDPASLEVVMQYECLEIGIWA
jgi:hypothetical protein